MQNYNQHIALPSSCHLQLCQVDRIMTWQVNNNIFIVFHKSAYEWSDFQPIVKHI